MFWNIKGHFGGVFGRFETFQDILVCFGTFWENFGRCVMFLYVLGVFWGIFWFFLKRFFALWDMLGLFGNFWDFLGHFGTFWNISGRFGIF